MTDSPPHPPHPRPLAAAEREALEAYFLRSGLPHLAEGYDPREDTLTRLRPALLVVFVIGLALVLRPDWPWWARALGVAAGLGIALGGLAALNLARGRPPLAPPERVSFTVAAVFVLAPAAADLVLGASLARAAVVGAGAAAAAAVLYALTSLGVVSLLVHLGEASLRGLARTAGVALRAMPPVLAVLLFLFLASEVWQAFGRLEGWRFGGVLVAFALLGAGFLIAVLRTERQALYAPGGGEELARRAAGTPAAPLVARGVTPLAPPLGRLARLNLGVAMLVSLGARVVAVGMAVAAFFTLFGVLVIDEGLTASWTGQPAEVLVRLDAAGATVVVSEELVRVAVLLGGFAALYFAVVAVSEARNREQFVDDELERLASVMAAWAYYRGALVPVPGPGTAAQAVSSSS